MICSSGIGFDPLLDGERHLFGFHGIWQGTAVLYDVQTMSIWFHTTGVCIEGRWKGRQLEMLRSGRHGTWAAWLEAHPSTTVMAREERFVGKPDDRGYFQRGAILRGSPFFPGDFPATIQTRDDRLAQNALVYGIEVEGNAVAFSLTKLVQRPLLQRTVGNLPIVVWYDAASTSVAVFDRRFGTRTCEFEIAGDGRLRERTDGNVFDLEGRCLEGPAKGRQLTPVPGLLLEWYGWSAHHAQTELK